MHPRYLVPLVGLAAALALLVYYGLCRWRKTVPWDSVRFLLGVCLAASGQLLAGLGVALAAAFLLVERPSGENTPTQTETIIMQLAELIIVLGAAFATAMTARELTRLWVG